MVQTSKALTSDVLEAVQSIGLKINYSAILEGQAAMKLHLDRGQSDIIPSFGLDGLGFKPAFS